LDEVVARRRLGEQERLLHYMHRYGALISVTVLHIRGPLTADLVRAGLANLQRRHPMLRAHLRHARWGWRRRLPFLVSEQELVSEGTGPIRLIETDQDWRDVTQYELATYIRSGPQPRMRATLTRRDAQGVRRLILTIDHGIADAQATAIAVRDLMAYFADPVAAMTVPPSSAGLPPALEEAYRKPVGRKRPYQPAIRLPFTKRPEARIGTAAIRQRFTLGETDAIRTAARAHGTTMHGVTSAAVLAAVHERYGLSEVTALSTIEHRRLCTPPLPAATFGCYIDILRTRHALTVPFWDLASDIAFTLVRTLARNQEQASILQLPGWPVYRHETVPAARSQARLDAVAITYAGEIGVRRDYGAFTLEDMDMMVSLHALGPGIFTVGLEREGQLELGLSYATHTLSAEEVGDIADRAAARLRNLPA
jgi:hypothetical protein